MSTVYNLHFTPVEKGLVEIMDVYGGSYFAIAVDGQIIENIFKESFEPTVLKRKFIKKCCEVSGQTEDKLVFVLVDWYGAAVDDNYDSNEYLDDYQNYLNHISQNGLLQTTDFRLLAVGVEQLEEVL